MNSFKMIVFGLMVHATFAVCQSKLLLNSGFEFWEGDSQLTYWEKESGCEMRQDTSACEGQFCVHLKKTGKNNRGIYQDVSVQPGHAYVFESKVNITGDAGVGILIIWYSVDMTYLGYSGPKKSVQKTGWQTLQLTVQSPSEAAIGRCRIRVYKNSKDFCLVDAIQLIE